jgi:hypothetical protein
MGPLARIGGIPNYPFVVLPHPLGSLDRGGLRERAIQAAPEVA